MTFCEHCEKYLPEGCGHIAGHHKECLLGPRTDIEWIVGMAIWEDLTDRRGVKTELQACETSIQVEIIETIGRKAIAAYNGVRPVEKKTERCIVKGCEHRTDQGLFVGSLCFPCYEFIIGMHSPYSQAYRNAMLFAANSLTQSFRLRPEGTEERDKNQQRFPKEQG